MKTLVSAVSIRNRETTARVIVVEPWAHDFTLLPGEALEIHATGKDTPPSFEFVEWNNTTQVYCNDAHDFNVTQGDVELHCGHRRAAEER